MLTFVVSLQHLLLLQWPAAWHTLTVCVTRSGFAMKSLRLSSNINENWHRSPQKNMRMRAEVGGGLIASVALCCSPLCSLKKYKYWWFPACWHILHSLSLRTVAAACWTFFKLLGKWEAEIWLLILHKSSPGLSFHLYMSASDDVRNVTWVNVSNHILNVRRLCAGTL